ncbi:MAG: hypothetical protein KF694_19545 [Mesorhizobium sp.]|nr:hypothetical protein [Mesorhizobium sp.]
MSATSSFTSLGLKYPPGSIEGIEAALERGDNEGAIVAVLRDALELADDEIEAFRSSPLWPLRVAAAPTVARECHAEEDWVYVDGRFDSVTARTLFLTGAESVATIVEATRHAAGAVPGARIEVLPGHAHFAHRTDPQMVRDIISGFLAS